MNNLFKTYNLESLVETNGVINVQNSFLSQMHDNKVASPQQTILTLDQVDYSLKDHMYNLPDVSIVSNPQEVSENTTEVIQDNISHTTQNNQNQTNSTANENSTKVDDNTDTATSNFVYRVVYPEELNLKPLINKQEKRGRPKKRPVVVTDEEEPIKEKKEKAVKSARTRSGRIIRPPKYIEKDFKRIETKEYDENEEELTTTEFIPLATSQTTEKVETPKLFESLQTHQKKRTISARYRCPKCQKAYLGRNRMLRHLQDNPEHGPIPDHCKDNNFEAWNFLVDITQKCSMGNKGKKFCDELTNLLHNVKLLARVLFKTSKDQKNIVKIDRVLGNALEITPGEYRFNENELHKDVTVLSLLENSRFFEDTYLHNDVKDNTTTSVQKNNNDSKTNEQTQNSSNNHSKAMNKQNANSISDTQVNTNCFGSETSVYHNGKTNDSLETNVYHNGKTNGYHNGKINDSMETNAYHNSKINDRLETNVYHNGKTNDSLETNAYHNVKINDSLETNIYHNGKTNDSAKAEKNCEINVDSSLSLHSDLLSDNSLLGSLPNLILSGEDTGNVSNLLENSGSSDEVMNVDQFVNERFRKITESETDVQNGHLNLDLPPLDLFHFHDS